MSTASGKLELVIFPAAFFGISMKNEVCNHCATGRHLDFEHLSGKTLATYITVQCPLCNSTSIKTRARVRKIKCTP